MGAWGELPFENDNALDWVWSLEAARDFSVLTAALDAAASQDEILDVCEEAIAAAEVVAALRGHPLPELPDEVTQFVERHGEEQPSLDLVKLAATVVRRISEASDLRDRWEEAGSGEHWLKTTDDLLKRLGQ
jgi:hypothetical protein